MKREEELRAFWESKIPEAWDAMFLVDAHRAINRHREGQRPIISLRTLQRRAADGLMGAFGGPGTGLGDYRVRRKELIDFLVTLDPILLGDDPGAPAKSEPRPATPKKRRRRGGRKAQPAAPPQKPHPAPGKVRLGVQQSLFGEEEP